MRYSGVLLFLFPEARIVQALRRCGFWFSLKEPARAEPPFPDSGVQPAAYAPPSSFGTLFAFLFFIACFLFLILAVPMDAWKAVRACAGMLVSGVSRQAAVNDTLASLFLIASGTGLCTVTPPLRHIFVKFPWLYPYMKLGIADMGVLALFTFAVSHGFAAPDSSRNGFVPVAAFAVLAGSRLAMCACFSKRPARPFLEDWLAMSGRRASSTAGMIRVKRFGWLCLLFGFAGFVALSRIAPRVP